MTLICQICSAQDCKASNIENGKQLREHLVEVKKIFVN
jgi:hypothetical protein